MRKEIQEKQIINVNEKRINKKKDNIPVHSLASDSKYDLHSYGDDQYDSNHISFVEKASNHRRIQHRNPSQDHQDSDERSDRVRTWSFGVRQSLRNKLKVVRVRLKKKRGTEKNVKN